MFIRKVLKSTDDIKQGKETKAGNDKEIIESSNLPKVEEELTPEEMMAKLGIPVNFDTTKGKQVEGNDISGAKVKSQREYRQYMNRRGGFNRELDKEHSSKTALRLLKQKKHLTKM